MMKRVVLAFGFMLASSVPWYLPALFLSCLLWAFSVQLKEPLRERGMLRGLFMWAPPVLTAGLLLSRAADLFSLNANHPEVALMLGQGADLGLRFKVLMTGQGAVEGALCSLFVFSILSPRLPSLRAASIETASFVQSRMMAHAGWWGLVVLMLLFEPSAYQPVEVPPDAPTVAPNGWSSLALIAATTLLLMMAGETLTSTAHMASSGETQRLLHRAVLKTLVTLVVVWIALLQSDLFTSTWWARPRTDVRLAVALLITVHATLMTTVHAFSTAAEGLQILAGRQATTLAWGLGVSALVLMIITSSVVHSVHLYPEGIDAVLIGWRWTSLAFFFGVGAMVLPTVGFDAAHHPEAWWFRVALAMVLPIGVLFSDGGWLLVPGLLFAGAGQQLVVVRAVSVDSTSMRFVAASLAWLLCMVGSAASNTPINALVFALCGLVVTSAVALDVLRIERAQQGREPSV